MRGLRTEKHDTAMFAYRVRPFGILFAEPAIQLTQSSADGMRVKDSGTVLYRRYVSHLSAEKVLTINCLWTRVKWTVWREFWYAVLNKGRSLFPNTNYSFCVRSMKVSLTRDGVFIVINCSHNPCLYSLVYCY
jgi:hypothetical protein